MSRLAVFRRSRHIGLYWPLASEADPRPLIDLHATAHFYLPVVEGCTLRFAPWPGTNTRWRHTAIGVHEPLGSARCPPVMLDLLVMPLAAFDARAHRIGMGGGFYDRSLAAFAACPFRGPSRIGLAFECQRVESIVPKPWDISLTAVTTPWGIHRYGASP